MKKDPYVTPSAVTVAVEQTAVLCQSPAIQDNSIGGCIPYLYHFSLRPSFTLGSKDTRFVVRVGGAEQKSGVSEQDFSTPVEYEVYDSITGAGAFYTVSVTNTGLPVVVLDQHSKGVADNKGFNKFLDMVIPAKSSTYPNGDEWYRNSNGGRTKYSYDESIVLMKYYISSRMNGMDTAVSGLSTSTNSKR